MIEIAKKKYVKSYVKGTNIAVFISFILILKYKDIIKLFSLCELIPGATLIQILLCVYYIKTKSFWIALLGIGLFLLPGIFCLTVTYLVFYKFINYFYEKTFFLILESGVFFFERFIWALFMIQVIWFDWL